MATKDPSECLQGAQIIFGVALGRPKSAEIYKNGYTVETTYIWKLVVSNYRVF